MEKLKLKDVLKQYRNTIWVEDNKSYKQVTITQEGKVVFRGEKIGKEIGRKRQFRVDLKKYPNTLMFIRQGVFNGGIGIASPEVDECIATENMPMFEVINVKPQYLLYYLKSSDFKNKINKIVPLGTAQKAIHENQLLEIEFILPETDKQNSVIKELNNKFRFLNKLNLNYNSISDYINFLRQSILQEAVQGKLVPQDPNDEPASELLKRIKAEKEKQLSPIKPEEIPYELPKGWEWVRLGEITTIKGGKRVPNGYKLLRTPTDHIYIRVTDMKNGSVDDTDLHYISDDVYNGIKEYIIEKEDLYLTIVGATIGKLGTVPDKFNKMNLTENAARLILHSINKLWLKYFLNSTLVQKQFVDKTKQVGVQKIALHRVKATLLPLPPIKEQARIVEKIESLSEICDNLELKINESKQYSEQLMDAVLREAFSNKF